MLKHVGEVISPEMETLTLLWLAGADMFQPPSSRG
jgi:hypothetical protein